MIKVRKFSPLNSFLEYTISNQNMSSSLAFHASMILHSDGSDPRIGPGSARDRPFLKGSGSNFEEGPRLGIGSGSSSRIEGPEGP